MTTLVEQKRQTTVEHLVRAAVAGLTAHGLAVTVDDIAREAGVSRRTIFRHFATRDELLAVALTQQSDTFRATLPQLGDQGWPAWLAELCQAVHQANDTLHRTLHELVTRHDLSPPLLAFADVIDAYRRGRNSEVADTLWRAIGQHGETPPDLRAVVASHLSPHFTTAVSQDARGDHSLAASLAQAAIRAALDRYSPTVSADSTAL
ncbi:TetR/AcrR family transcriptional regulator [Mycolicibacterium sp. ELW1]|uniref:TetR/AcrR family transcriptional regulator n=1 Tax=Mycobacteriaceae TaxID=1762 RepID=UPI0011EE2376|nr:TetR/AcrR family transcriptional regulator [Mycobacterium sp. ELW1]QEN12898.1 TetR/AcrR family transcriptional regulator [Mycobacterium sp. ELW1]